MIKMIINIIISLLYYLIFSKGQARIAVASYRENLDGPLKKKGRS